MKVTIRVTRGRLRELRGRKDFWSEVVFQEGYDLAPTRTMADAKCLEQVLPLELHPRLVFDWGLADPSATAWSWVKLLTVGSTCTPVYPEWQDTRKENAPKRQAA